MERERVARLPRPVAVALVAALLICATAAWAITAAKAGAMGPSTLPMMGASLFLITWLVMMVAMMFPSVAPMVLAHASVARARHEGYFATAVFVAGYLAVWTAAGLVPLAIVQASDQIWMAPPSWLPRAEGAAILLAGIYQLTPLKDTCLRACRSPLGFVLSHDFGGGAASAVRAGASHGLYCLGCCWALMAVLVILGLMSIAWMALVAVVFFVEKNVARGELLPRLVAAVCIVGGLAVIAAPGSLLGSSG